MRNEAQTENEFLFFRENHEYTLNGKKIPSVSEIISPLSDEIDESLEIIFEIAAERGSALHKVLELLLKGNGEPEYPDAYEGYTESIRLFLSEHTITPYAIERPIYHPALCYAGTPDLFCEFDGSVAILDYKFVSQINKPKVKAQLNAYADIYFYEGLEIEKLYVVQFMPDGEYRIYPTAIDSTEFTHCLAVYNDKNKKHPRGAIA